MYKSTEIMNESQVKKDVYIRKNEKELLPVNTVLSIGAVDWLWLQARIERKSISAPISDNGPALA